MIATATRVDRQPKAYAEYWSSKIARNKARDVQHQVALRADVWRVRVVWECEIKKPGPLARLRRFLDR
jgi:DNA mismatch endonuclease, patch repair protein